MACVGALRTFGAPAPLNLVVRLHGFGMSSGFFVVLLVGSLVVVAPSIIASCVCWKRGGYWRAPPIIGAVLIAVLAALLLPTSEWPHSCEERTVLFLAAWGMAFYALVAFAFFAALTRQTLKRTGGSK
jgi:hypothetical protein